MPCRYVNLLTGKTSGEISNPAEIGTYIVEYGILSRHTGDPSYYDKAKKAMLSLYEKRSPIGLTGSSINVETGKWVSTDSHISGGIDSYLEYMLKASILFDDKEMSKMWETSSGAVITYLADRTHKGLWYGHADMVSGKIFATNYGALDAFYAGSLVLAGKLEDAAALQESNYKMWMLKDIEPEEIDYNTMTVTSPGYALRPENLEGAYYLYQVTGDNKYLEMGSVMFRNLLLYCKNEAGFCALKNVETKEKSDSMESFFLAETLKYAYLLFDESGYIQFKDVIFNTEAHPYKRINK
jgi:mannosidase alpha-like ER degradation enhancer 2